MNRRNILVTATGGRSVGSGILHALTRTSHEITSRWNVVAADADTFAWGLYKAKQSTLLPPAQSPEYIDNIKAAADKFNIHAIIPGSEPEAEVLARNLKHFNIPVLINSADMMPLMADKFKAAEKLTELGFPSIPTFKIEEWQNALDEFGFPLIVKPATFSGGSKGVSICTNPGELQMKINSLSSGSRYCIQPVIGTEDDEYTVGVLSDKDGKLIDSIIMKRKLTGLSLLDTKSLGTSRYSISTGYSQGYFIKDPKIQSFCEELSAKLGSKGPLNLQLRIQNDRIYVFEIHPRFSGTTPMRADLGFNEPDIMLRNHLDNEKFGRLNYIYNVAAIRAFEHVIVPIEKML